MSYAPLWCKSNFSFLEGASRPEELVEQAHQMGLRSLALTDRDGVYGVVRAHEKARELGLHLIIGAQITVAPVEPRGAPGAMPGMRTGAHGELLGGPDSDGSDGSDGNENQNSSSISSLAAASKIPEARDQPLVVLLVQDRAGYANLCQLITVGRRRAKKGECEVSFSELCAHAPGLLALCASDGSRGLLVGERDPAPTVGALQEAFGDRLYALLPRHRRPEEVQSEARLRERAARFGLPLVAGNEVLYHSPARRPLQDVLACIRHGVTVHTAGRRIKPNAEHDLKPPFAFSALYADDPAALARTEEVAARCTFSLADLRYRYPSERLPDGKTTSDLLRELTYEGAAERYRGDVPEKVRAQIEKELVLIADLDYAGYFLTMKEIVVFCRAQDILCQGRGSAANSAVCYCLGVTAVDPVKMELLFERFISRERAEPPDIDLDIEHERREEVIQHVYEKYGRSHAAMVANVIRYRDRSALRDVGKALGYSETALERVSRLLSHNTIEGAVAFAELDPSAGTHAHLLRLSNELLGFPRHLSIHPGGFLLGHEPVSTLVPIENATMEGRTVIQWDKDDVESLGLFKVDLLGLGSLTHLHRCFDLIARHRGKTFTLATVPAADEATYKMIGKGDTVGVFQIESRAQMSMLPRLKPVNYYDLVIEVSIVRPGPISGGMVHPYLRRRDGLEPIDYPHPSLIPVLERTKGIPLFQEQVMQIAVVAADYTPGEADQLRRDMAAWRRDGRIEKHRERLITRMEKKGITNEFAERIFKQICGFGEYGFPESHAASFAILSYVGSYLKRHFPVEFTCGILNAWPMGFYTPATIIEDARRHGVEVRPIDVGSSQWACTLEPSKNEHGFALRMGLRYVKGLGEADGRSIAEHAPFRSLEDFTRRMGLSERARSALAQAGAFESLGVSRRGALWQARGHRPIPLPVDHDPSPRFAALSDGEIVDWDYRHSGHSTHGHPLTALRDELRAQGIPDAKAIAAMKHGRRVRYAGLVICRQHPGTAAGVTFMTLEDESGLVNLVLWRQVFEAYSIVARTQSFLGVTGKLQKQDDVVHLIAEELWQPEVSQPPEEIESRDFH